MGVFHRHAGGIGRCPSDLEIEATGVGITVDDLAGKL